MDILAFVLTASFCSTSSAYSSTSIFASFLRNRLTNDHYWRQQQQPQQQPVDEQVAVVDLGTIDNVKILFSYPNHYCHSIQFLMDQTLEETVTHYLQSSLRRDGFSKHTTTLTVQTKRNGHVYAVIQGDAAPVYKEYLPKFLEIGNLAFRASQNVHADKKWRYNWRFFLPLGLAMTRHYTVQLMHFPPDYILGQEQDHLAARTTKRWGSLLQINHNNNNSTGVVVMEDQDRYQTILDILPIAAPSRDGKNFDGVYEYYQEYILELLKLWVIRKKDDDEEQQPAQTKNLAAPRPIVAFGWPVRQWIQSTFKTHNLQVLDVITIPITSQQQAPVIIANHPSYYYNAAELRSEDTPDMELLRKILIQDLIVARWQVLMGQSPDSSLDPQQVLEEAKQYWTSPMQEPKIRELLQEYEKTNTTVAETKR
jgi:hypothetical protein